MKLSFGLLCASAALFVASGAKAAPDDFVAVADEAPRSTTEKPHKNLRRAQGNPFDDAQHVTMAPGLEAKPNSFIVTLKSGASAESLAPGLAEKAGGAVGRTYKNAISGFSVQFPAQAAADSGRAILESDDEVLSVTPNYIAHATATTTTQTSLPDGLWGLDRIDSAGAKDGNYEYMDDGSDVHIYIMDSGVNTAHVEFTGRIGNGAHFEEKDVEDNNGHGTHCASTAAGTTYGVAKKATIHPVKVLGRQGSGTLQGILDGCEWVIGQCPSGSKCVASLSLSFGGEVDEADAAVAAMANAGIVVSIAAGNNNKDACGYSPKAPGLALNVGSVDDSSSATNARSSFSNYGSCVDVFAPGGNVLGAWKGGTTATAEISGTSMACPHVTGAAALLIQRKGSTAGIRDDIVNMAVAGRVTNPGSGSPNLLLQTTAAVTLCTDANDCDDGDICTTDTCGAGGICTNTFVADGVNCVAPTTPPTPPAPETCSTPGACGSGHQCDAICCNGCTGADDIYSTQVFRRTCYCGSCSGKSITCG